MIRRFISRLFNGPLLLVLTTSFVLIAILTGVLNTLVISRVINNYLVGAQSDRVERDMVTSLALYQQSLDAVARMNKRVALEIQTILDPSTSSFEGTQTVSDAIGQVISHEITNSGLIGTQAILMLDPQGRILNGEACTTEGCFSIPRGQSSWDQLSVVAEVLKNKRPMEATEVIPANFLAQLGLSKQALVSLRNTSQDSPLLYDQREGTAGMVQMAVHPLLDSDGRSQGAIVTFYLFNNNFAFIDNIKNVAQVETATIFLGDLRVSTNVVDSDGVRAIGTRVSQIIYDRVLIQGESYLGRVSVVGDWYTGRYEPLRDHTGKVVGMLYVGVREAVFYALIDAFDRTATLIALISVIVAGLIAIPIALVIARPTRELAVATQRLAVGDMNVHVVIEGSGEIAMLSNSFNNMVQTLQVTQNELLHKEKLASMGQLAAGVAHELNNPLGSILLFADALYQESPEDCSQHDDLKMIINETHRCKVIVSDLLNFARQQELLAQDTNMNVLLKEVSDKVATQPRFEQIEVNYDLDPLLPIIQADPAQLQQVFYNVLYNAADAMETGGRLPSLRISWKATKSRCG